VESCKLRHFNSFELFDHTGSLRPDIRSSVAGGPAGGRGKTGKERQSHNLLLLLNVMASSLEEVPRTRFR
jgi:hypothetical protein